MLPSRNKIIKLDSSWRMLSNNFPGETICPCLHGIWPDHFFSLLVHTYQNLVQSWLLLDHPLDCWVGEESPGKTACASSDLVHQKTYSSNFIAFYASLSINLVLNHIFPLSLNLTVLSCKDKLSWGCHKVLTNPNREGNKEHNHSKPSFHWKTHVEHHRPQDLRQLWNTKT